ncbi:hypothetical protein BH23BAC2_BH23BAC2_07940 [soil metagenome]
MMKSNRTISEVDIKSKLSLLWLFAMLTYTYRDVVTLMDPIKHGSIELTEGWFPSGRLHLYDDSAFNGPAVHA